MRNWHKESNDWATRAVEVLVDPLSTRRMRPQITLLSTFQANIAATHSKESPPDFIDPLGATRDEQPEPNVARVDPCSLRVEKIEPTLRNTLATEEEEHLPKETVTTIRSHF
uniref:Uncharacterized protein n=1 Tax=Parascaris equorum TaxID=6256 RepID=A0A914RMX2_PAREQ